MNNCKFTSKQDLGVEDPAKYVHLPTVEKFSVEKCIQSKFPYENIASRS